MVSPASKRRVVSYILREYEQVAAITGKSTAGAARMAVTRALERLRAAIDGPSA